MAIEECAHDDNEVCTMSVKKFASEASTDSARWEKFKEDWEGQIIRDRPPSCARDVGAAIRWHINRDKFLNGERTYAWPSIDLIVEETGMGRMSAIRGAQWLVDHGHLEVSKTRKGAKNEVTAITLF